jgi:hypothetical protein
MIQGIQLKNLEKRAFRSTFEDGLWDIYLGGLLFLMGMGPGLVAFGLSSQLIMVVLIVTTLLLMAGFFLSKRIITIPRLGLVKVGKERKMKLRKVTLLFSFSVLVGLIFFFAPILGFDKLLDFIGLIPVPALAFGIMSILCFGIAAYFMDYPLFLLYGFLYAVPFPLAVILNQSLDIRFAFLFTYPAASVPMLCLGGVHLYRFMNRYDVTESEVHNDSP